LKDIFITTQPFQKIDFSELKANQLMILLLNLLAVVFNLPVLSVFAALITGLGYMLEVPGFWPFYAYVWVPLGLLKREVLDDHHEPHHFAQLLGFYWMTAGAVAHFLGLTTFGWVLIWVVVVFTALNVFGGFCVGCAVYHWLGRLNVPGFTKDTPSGTFPGMKPKAKVIYD
jgi:hypothetical protein